MHPAMRCWPSSRLRSRRSRPPLRSSNPWRNAVRLDPYDGETQLVLGYAFAYQGMADQALDQFAKAEALAPNNADLLINIAWCLPQFGQFDRAVELTEKALKLNSNYPYWYNQGLRLVYFYGRQFDKSVKYAKLITNPFATDYAYLAAASAMAGDTAGGERRRRAGGSPGSQLECREISER